MVMHLFAGLIQFLKKAFQLSQHSIHFLQLLFLQTRNSQGILEFKTLFYLLAFNENFFALFYVSSPSHSLVAALMQKPSPSEADTTKSKTNNMKIKERKKVKRSIDEKMPFSFLS